MEAINDSSKLVAQSIEKLKHCLSCSWILPYDPDMEIKECVELLEEALETLAGKM